MKLREGKMKNWKIIDKNSYFEKYDENLNHFEISVFPKSYNGYYCVYLRKNGEVLNKILCDSYSLKGNVYMLKHSV